MAAIGRRVVVYGPSGSGKSTLARALAERLAVPVVELDAIYHGRPGWDDLSRDEFREAVAAILARETGGWVIEGNYGMVRDLILPLAETAVWLRLPFRTVYPRLVRRTIVRGLRHELLWGISHWRAGIRNTAAGLARIPHHARVIELRSPRAVRSFLAHARP